MVIFAVTFAIFFCGIKKKLDIRIFVNLHLLSFLMIYSLELYEDHRSEGFQLEQLKRRNLKKFRLQRELNP